MSTLSTIHPRQALFGSEPLPPTLPVCDHYSGVEARMRKSLMLQAEMAEAGNGRAVFDVTLDLEDGAPVGGEHEQALLVAELIDSPQNVCDRVGVRVHDPRHRRFEDDVDTLIKAAGPRLAYIMVPKLANVADAQRAIDTIKAARLRQPGGGEAGGDLEPDAPLQPALPPLLHDLGGCRLSRRAFP